MAVEKNDLGNEAFNQGGTVMNDKIERKVEMFPVGSRASYLKATEGTASPRTAIKVFCTECMGYNLADAKDCVTVECPLFRYMKRDNKGL